MGLLSEQTLIDFSETGLLSHARGFEFRPEQQQMAVAVAETPTLRRTLNHAFKVSTVNNFHDRIINTSADTARKIKNNFRIVSLVI